MDIRRNLFLMFGLERGYPGARRASSGRWHDTIVEPREARACRRNVIILAGGVVLAWAAGADVRDLDLFGVNPAEGRGVIVLSMAAILVHIYWYCARYWHLKENSTRSLPASMTEIKGKTGDINWKQEWNEAAYVSLRVADLLANWAAALLTLLSWCILTVWMLNAQPTGA